MEPLLSQTARILHLDAARAGQLVELFARPVVDADPARHVGGGLSLNNLRRLSATQAYELGRHEHELSLNRIRELGLGPRARAARQRAASSGPPAALAVRGRHAGVLELSNTAIAAEGEAQLAR